MHGGVPQIKAPPWLDRGGGWRQAVGSPVRITGGEALAAGRRGAEEPPARDVPREAETRCA
jgi:hypothetical protein